MKSDDIKLLLKAKECAIEAGIYDKMFLSFGTLLGAIRPTKRKDNEYHLGLMEHDKDMDIGWLPISMEEKERYHELCKKSGLLHWENPEDRAARLFPDGELVWFSIRSKELSRSCNWFFFEWSTYMWHSKGGNWLNDKKFPPSLYLRRKEAQAIMLGAPAKYFVQLKEIEFEGELFNIPLFAGSLCDFWYPGWCVPRVGGASEKKVTGVIYDWKDKETWRLI